MNRADTLDLVHVLTRTHKTTIENDDGTNHKKLREHAPYNTKHDKIETAPTSAYNTHQGLTHNLVLARRG